MAAFIHGRSGRLFVGFQEQLRPPKEAGAGGLYLMIVRAADRSPGDQDYIPTGPNFLQLQPHRFAQPSLDAIAPHRIADPAVHGKAEPAVGQIVGQSAQHEQLVGKRAPLTANFLEPLVCADSITPLHDLWLLPDYGAQHPVRCPARPTCASSTARPGARAP